MKSLAASLGKWYLENHRELPWRKSRDPYRIWISEVMLQQTTVQAVVPYYERFMATFPTVQSLAEASLEEVYELWAGLGYYSRARNLHKSAITLAKIDFPKTHTELIELPGFGPYTSRAVSSLAFNESVGVLDGNVVRVLSRIFGEKIEWWLPKGRHFLQQKSDDLVRYGEAHTLNQALMELGAVVCTPKSPACMLCPWVSKCVARKNEMIAELPLPKPRKASEVWIWKPKVIERGGKVAVLPNDYAPFLKGQLIFPGEISTSKAKPKKFDLRHGITHHDIYIQIQKENKSQRKDYQWYSPQDLKRKNPSSLLQKILQKAP